MGYDPNEESVSSYRLSLITLFIGSFVAVYHIVSLNVSLPGFIQIFHSELGTVQWLITGFTLATGIIAPISGYLGNRFSNKKLFLFSICGLTVSSILCSFAWNVYVLIIFRIIQGIFCGLIQPVSLAMIYQTIPRGKQALAISLWSASTILGPALAPTISGWLQGYNWRWMFLVTVPLGIITYAMGTKYLPYYRVNITQRLDRRGMVLAITGSLILLSLFGNVHRWGWFSGNSIICLIIGLTAILLFIQHELKVKEPLLQLRLFKSRTFTASLAASVVLMIGLYSGIYFIPLYLQEIHGLSSYEVGVLLIPPALSLALATILSGKVYDRVGPMPLVAIGAILLAAASWKFSHLRVDTTLTYVAGWMSIRYIGIGLSMTPAMNAGMRVVSRNLSGHAAALINWLRQVSGALALGMFTSIFYSRMGVHLEELNLSAGQNGEKWVHSTAYTMSVDDAFLIAGLFALTAVPLALLLHQKGDDTSEEQTGTSA
ncbi:DHA2 family efflux MFS transporter permease subunit [Bacillus sp. OTU530]|uniref:DHA2 family efflux MFS transporter permease subunit n=1 Tax=Bacillus sp. OTU530 TaxID=3043862 RepID=UPI00313E06A4